jgi:hypothetical protein
MFTIQFSKRIKRRQGYGLSFLLRMMTNRIEVFLLKAWKIFLLVKPEEENITSKNQ